MNLTTIEDISSFISGDNMLQEIRTTRISDRMLNTEVVSVAISALTGIADKTILNAISKRGDTNIGPLSLTSDLEVGKNVNCCRAESNPTKGSIAAGENSYIAPKACMSIQSVTSCIADEEKYYVVTVNPALSSELAKIELSNDIAIYGNHSSVYANPQKIARIDSAAGKIYFKISDDISYEVNSISTYFQNICNRTPVNHYIMFHRQPTIGGDYTFNAKGPAYGFGEFNTVMCDDSIAIGAQNTVIGRGSCGIGFRNDAGHFATAIGGGNKAYAKFSIAMGCNTATNTSQTGNIPNVVIMNPASNSFAWSAGDGVNDQYVISSLTRRGTFNINPIGDSAGFYIGHKNLPSIVREIVDGYNISDTNARVIAVELDGDTLTSTITAKEFVDNHIDKIKPTYTEGTEPEEKTPDEIKDEAEHLYAMTREDDNEYAYYQIRVTQVDGENQYNWQKVTEKNKTSYIKKEGDTDIGGLHLTGELSVDGMANFEKGVYIGNQPETLYAPSANMMFALGQNLSVLGTNSMSMGSGCIAGTNVLSVVDMYFTDDHTNGMVQNTMKLDSVEGLTPGMVFLAKITSNYGTTGTILNIDAGSKVISCDIIPVITKSGWTNIQTNCQANLANGQTMIGANKTTNQCVIWIKDHPEIGTIAYADGAHAEGIKTKATQDCCHAEGNQTVALGKYSHAEGNKTYAGYNGHSEGCQTSAMIILRKQDDSDRAVGYVPDSGDGGDQSMHAEGTVTKADQRYTHADGKYTWARHRNSYAWNGDMTTTTSSDMYQSHGEGTYNINPKNGIDGFYIGDKSLAQYIDVAINDLIVEGHVDTDILCDIDIETARGGIYGSCLDEDMNQIIFGTYKDGLWNYNLLTRQFTKCRVGNDEFGSVRIKSIVKIDNSNPGQIRYLAAGLETLVIENATRVFLVDLYSSIDGVNWTVIRHDGIDLSKTNGTYSLEIFDELTVIGTKAYMTAYSYTGDDKSMILTIDAAGNTADVTSQIVDNFKFCRLVTIDNRILGLTICKNNVISVVPLSFDESGTITTGREFKINKSSIFDTSTEQTDLRDQSIQLIGPWSVLSDQNDILIGYNASGIKKCPILKLTYDASTGEVIAAECVKIIPDINNKDSNTPRQFLKRGIIYFVCTYLGDLYYSFDKKNWSFYLNFGQNILGIECMCHSGSSFYFGTRHIEADTQTLLRTSRILVDRLQLQTIADIQKNVDAKLDGLETYIDSI